MQPISTIYGQFIPTAPGTLNTEAQKHPHLYVATDTPVVGHNASFDVLIQQAIDGQGTVPDPLPPMDQTPLT